MCGIYQCLGKDPAYEHEAPQARRLRSLPLDDLLESTARLFGVDPDAFAQPGSVLQARDLAAWLARRLTTATLRDLAPHFGLTHPDSVSNLTRRATRTLEKSPRARKQAESLRKSLHASDKPKQSMFVFPGQAMGLTAPR